MDIWWPPPTVTITSGSMVSLFNRVNSQTVRTKFVCAESGRLAGKGTTWSAVQIYLAPHGTAMQPTPPDAAAAAADGGGRPASLFAITYGSPVILRCVDTNIWSDPLVVHKVVDNVIVPNCSGPVSQMQKVALEHAGRPNQFLSLPAEDQPGCGPFLCFQTAGAAGAALGVNLQWTIVGVERTVFRFAQPSEPFAPHVTPLANVTHAALNTTVVELHGRNFRPGTVVCLGSTPLFTRVLSADRISCILPTTPAAGDRLVEQPPMPGAHVDTALLLCRSDGVVSHSGYHFLTDTNFSQGGVPVPV